MTVRHVQVAAVLCALALGSGCAAVQANRRAPGTLANGVLTPGRPGTAQYGPDPALLCPNGGAFPIVQSNAQEIARDSKRPLPQGDGRLCAMADALLAWKDEAPPPESVTSFLAWTYGLVGPPQRVVTATVESEDPRVLAQRMLDPINAVGQTAIAPRFGAVTQREKKGFTRVVVVVYDAMAELQPLPRRVEAGAQVPLRGTLAAGLTNPKLTWVDPSGKLESPAATEGSQFQANLACGPKPGMLLVEVRGQREGEAVTAARFPVMCGADLPTNVTVPAPTPKDGAVAAGTDRKIFDLVNAERTGAGAPPLQWDAGVAQVAKAASDTSRDESRSTSTTINFDIVGQLRKADVVSPLVLLNPAAARQPEEAHWRLAHSPVHRSNMLNAQATHGGVGVSSLTDPNLGAVYFVTELLVRENPPADTEAVKAKLRDLVAKKRADARADPVKSDPMLEEVAQKYADALAAARGDLPRAQESAIVGPLYKPFRDVSIVAGAKADPLEFAEEGGVASPGKAVGIGTAQGMNPMLGKNTVYVVILVGTRK